MLFTGLGLGLGLGLELPVLIVASVYVKAYFKKKKMLKHDIYPSSKLPQNQIGYLFKSYKVTFF